MTAPDPKWVKALEKAMDSSLSPEFQWWESSEERITFILGVVEPLIREQIAAEIEAAITYDERKVPLGQSFETTRTECLKASGMVVAARIARGGAR